MKKQKNSFPDLLNIEIKKQRKIKVYEAKKLYFKNIELPGWILTDLEELAAGEKRKLKPFMEKVLEDYAILNNNKQKK